MDPSRVMNMMPTAQCDSWTYIEMFLFSSCYCFSFLTVKMCNLCDYFDITCQLHIRDLACNAVFVMLSLGFQFAVVAINHN